jgi:ABC-2 type transport system ATP-binding protein
MSSSQTEMISVRKLTKTYPGVVALDNVSFEIPLGEICGYIGTNGAGKSTTVKILTGVLDFDKGEVFIGGIDVKEDPINVKRIVGYVPETPNLFNSLSPREFIEFIGTARSIEGHLLRRRLDNFAEMFDFTGMLDQSIGNLSKGNKQKVLITSALIHNPDLIYFDEPLNGLDANSIFIFQDLVSYLVTLRKTILYCSHLLNTVEKVSSKIILLEKGKVVLDTRTSDLKNLANYTDLEGLFRNLREESETRKLSYESLFD